MPLLLSDDDVDEAADPPDQSPLPDDDDDEMFIDDDFEEEEFVESDPSGRYGRYAEVLGKGASKTVYRAYDRVDCKEVAWNQAKLNDSQGSAVQSEVCLLESLAKHKGIIKLQAEWVDTENGNINFITELCSATLLEYRMKHKHASRKAVKSWGRQILRGLAHLHSQTPPVVHRDLKCSNIFVKSRANSTLKLGDFGLAAAVGESDHRLHAIVGTPEFMAPEMFEEDYDELVDVYSFGMCMLELLTRECPYRECKSVAQIYKKVTSGVKPKSLSKVKDAQALRFIMRCLLPASQRPSANDLLSDPFLAQCSLENLGSDSSTLTKQVMPRPKLASSSPLKPAKVEATPDSETSDQLGDSLRIKTVLDAEATSPAGEAATRVAALAKTGHRTDEEMKTSNFTSCQGSTPHGLQRHFRVTGKREDETTVRLKLRIQQSCRSRDVCFPFDLQNDSPRSVAEEMVRALQYPDSDLVTISDLIGAEIAALAGANAVSDASRSIMRHVSSDSDLSGSKTSTSTLQQPEMDITESLTTGSRPRRFTINPEFAPSCFKELSCDRAPMDRRCTVQHDVKTFSITTNSGVNQLITGRENWFGPFHQRSVQRLPYLSKVFA